MVSFFPLAPLNFLRIYLVHDDAKEKEFELEMSWIGPESNNLHVHVPDDLFQEAEAKAKASLEEGFE
jgi:20S proteasome subunit alpha 7